MPLLPGKRNIGNNIATEQAAGKPRAQAVAIALNTARRSGVNIGHAKTSASAHATPLPLHHPSRPHVRKGSDKYDK